MYYELLSPHVKDPKRLKAMSKAGHIIWPSRDGPSFSYVDEPKERKRSVYSRVEHVAFPGCTFAARWVFEFNGNMYAIHYVDGCFAPFVFKIQLINNQ